MTNLEKYNQAFIEAFSVNELELNLLNYNGIPAWDSVGHMALVVAIEDAFNIEMAAEDIIDFSSYENGKEILKKYTIVIE